jgi:hypothetical protein
MPIEEIYRYQDTPTAIRREKRKMLTRAMKGN